LTKEHGRFQDLVEEDNFRIHASAYTSSDVFDAEMYRIFYRDWVYVGHESEIPQEGDYTTTYIGRIPVIVSRGDKGRIHVLVNRCAHRGALVCAADRGSGRTFTCDYHGWKYGIDGKLKGVTLRDGYGASELDTSQLGLVPMPLVESYCGLIFASVNDQAPPLGTSLGASKAYLDDWVRQAPDDQVVVTGEVWKIQYRGNWKLQADNSVEGYHPEFLHRSSTEVMLHNRGKSTGEMVRERNPTRGRGLSLGQGHGLTELPQMAEVARKRYPKEFLEALISRVGEVGLDAVLGPPWRMFLFPNVVVAGPHIRVIRPIAPDRTEVRQYFVDLPGAPDRVRTFRRMQEQGFYGPSGYGGPDDVEMFERIQAGLGGGDVGLLSPWILMNRGQSSEVQQESCVRSGSATSEVPQRGFYREWRERMSAGEP
jgi:phenylpropionate dioxygenase-like ring-hydroxylating dioxygenase large terminal subunit